LYEPFEATRTLKSTSADVYEHELPGGQLTNLHFQAYSLGLSDRWPQIKKAYVEANKLLGDIIKVTPSSKVVGDLAQFMVTNHLSAEELLAKAGDLSLPSSVVDFFQGGIGIPDGGFPSELRDKVLKGKRPAFSGRPGSALPALDFEVLRETLSQKTSSLIDLSTPKTLLTAALYPREFDQYSDFLDKYGPLTWLLPTPVFFNGLKVGEKVSVILEPGKKLDVELRAFGREDDTIHLREVFLNVNDKPVTLAVPAEGKGQAKSSGASHTKREKADKKNPLTIGAPMPGKVLRINVKVGDLVKKGDPLAVMSAMKMDTTVTSPRDGKIQRITATTGADLQAGDLIIELSSA
jgi:pyruvate carboxylase